MADASIFDLTQETAMTAAARLPLQESSGATRATSATFALLGGLEHSAEAADANIAGSVGTLHVVDMNDGTTPFTADRIFSLPTTAQVGERCGVYIKNGDATYKVKVRTTAASNDTIHGYDYDSQDFANLSITGDYLVFRCVTTDIDWILEGDGSVQSINNIGGKIGLAPSWTSLTAISIAAGECMVGSVRVIKSSSTALANTDIPAGAVGSDNDQDVLYIWINQAGTITIELYSAGTPTYNAALDQIIQGTDDTKRCIGALNIQNDSGTKEFSEFTSVVMGRHLRLDYFEDDGISNHLRILDNGTSTTFTGIAASAAAQRQHIPSISKEIITRVRLSATTTAGHMAINWNANPAGSFQAWQRLAIAGVTGASEFTVGILPYSDDYQYLVSNANGFFHYRGYIAYV